MRCKNHSTDLSSVVGVCASCLRERLFRVILAEEQAQTQAVEQNHCNLNTNPMLRRSVSPILNPVTIVQRPSNKPRLNHSVSDKRFYNSPQIAINTGGCIGGSSSNRKKQNLIRFPSISSLFRSNSRNGDADSNHNEACGARGRTGRPSWFSNVFPGDGVRQKNKAFYVDESSASASTGVVRQQQCVRDRGMSPVRCSDDGDEDEFSVGSSEDLPAESCKQTPVKTLFNQTARRGGGQKSVTELIFCPLVRPSPNRILSMKGKPPVDGGFSGDIRAPAVPHLAYAKSYCANRSRKLADFGRSDPNR